MLQSKRGSIDASVKPVHQEKKESNGKVPAVNGRKDSSGDAVPPAAAKRKDSITVPDMKDPVFERRRSSFCDGPHPDMSGRRGSVDIFDGKPNLGRRASVSPLAPKLEAPTIVMAEHPELGDVIELECKITSSTKPEVTWYHLDDKIKENKRYHMDLKNIIADQWVSTMEVRGDITRKDAGKYTVRAKNDMGTNAATVFSYVED